MDLTGVVNLDKPRGWTSHDAVAKIRRLSGQRRVGHGGTLDPLAQGVLPILLGRATRLMDFLQQGEKAYRADIALGTSTTTDDAEGEVIAQAAVPSLLEADIQAALEPFRGVIQQTPPAYSAIKVAGRRAYARARGGEQVELPPRMVTVYALELVEHSHRRLVIDITCAKGTYVRSFARDLARALGTVGHLAGLVRTRVGPFALDAAVSIEDLAAGGVLRFLLPADAALPMLPSVALGQPDAERFLHGQAVESPPLPAPALEEHQPARVYGPSGTLIGIGAVEGGLLRPRISLVLDTSNV